MRCVIIGLAPMLGHDINGVYATSPDFMIGLLFTEFWCKELFLTVKSMDIELLRRPG